jgi:hypothetical protein
LSEYVAAALRREGVSVRTKILAMAVGLALSACAGRDPHPVAVVQPQDQYSDCAMIRAEIDANNVQAQKLAEENGMKVAQNVAAGVVGVVIWPVWLAMDAKGAAGAEADALKARQEFLLNLAVQRCAQPAPARAQPPAPTKPQKSAATPPPADLVSGVQATHCGNQNAGTTLTLQRCGHFTSINSLPLAAEQRAAAKPAPLTGGQRVALSRRRKRKDIVFLGGSAERA